MSLARDVADARRLERQALLERVDQHPWSRRIDQQIDACVDAFDRGAGLPDALRHLLEAVGEVRGDLAAAFPTTLSEPARAVMAAMQYLQPLVGALMEAAPARARGPMFRTLLRQVLNEVASVTRRAVLQVPTAHHCELTAHGIRRALEG